jgi:Mrp family chromosome partitioning ATPase
VDCSERTAESFLKPLNKYSSVKKVIAVVSGKGGVGKSLVTSLITAKMQYKGHPTAILDADVTGPSIPKVFGVYGKCGAVEEGIVPAVTARGTKMMSINLLLENDTDPVVWRGPIIAGAVEQFWTEVIWGDVDYMFVDMPPGTGDVPLTVFQSLPVDGIIVVTSPQELVTMIVAKAVKMAEMMNIPVLGIVENMSYFKCPDCGKEHAIFGESHIDEIAKQAGIDAVARIPIDPVIARKCDQGLVEELESPWLDEIAKKLESLL